MKAYIATLLILFGLAAVEPRAYAKASSGDVAQVHGVVLDQMDAVIVGASILIEATDFRQQLNINEAGEFYAKLPDGQFRLSVTHPGFKTFVIKKLQVTGASKSGLRIVLKVKTPIVCKLRV